MVGDEAVRQQLVAMLRTPLCNALESRPDLDALDGVDSHHRVGNVGVKFVEERRAQTHRHTAGDDAQPGADRVARLAQFVQRRFEFRHNAGVRREKRIALDLVPRFERNDDFTDLLHAAAHLRAVFLAQPLLRQGAGRHHRRRQARRGAAAATRIAHAVLAPVRIVGVTRAEGICNVYVVLALRVLVADQQRDRGTRRAALVNPGQDLDAVGLAPLRHMPRGARFAAIEIRLQVRFGERQAGRAAVNHATDGRPVRFTEIGDLQQVPESGASHGISDQYVVASPGIVSALAVRSEFGAAQGGDARH